MIGMLTGRVESVETDTALIDVGGVGYEVRMSATDLSRLHAGQDTRVFTYMNLSQDAITLHGFLDRDAKKTFLQLIKVSGIGPKVAQSLLSTLTPSQLAHAITDNDATALAKAPGLGKKGAQKIILELKGSIDLSQIEGASAQAATSKSPVDTGTEQVDNGALVGVAGHQRCQRCIREVQCGVNNGGAEVISNENVNALYDQRSRRNGEQQDCCDAVRNHHPEDPCTGLAVLGMCAVNQVTDQYVGNTIEETREQHDGTDHCCGDADYVGVEVNQQRGCQGVDNVTGNVAEAVGKLFFEMDLLKFLITRESRVAGFAHGFAQSFFIFLFASWSCAALYRALNVLFRGTAV